MQHKSGRTAEEYDDLDKWIEIELRQTEAKQYEVSHTAQDTKLKNLHSNPETKGTQNRGR